MYYLKHIMKKNRVMVNCEHCGKTVSVIFSRVRKFRFCSRSCHGKVVLSAPNVQEKIKRKVGPENSRWTGGKTKRKDGYILVSVNGKRYFEHRYVMEQHLGRKLSGEENVHHINHDRGDNRIENLRLYSTRAEHTMHEKHVPKRKYNPEDSKTCIGCSRLFTRGDRPNSKFSKAKFCSHKCFMKNTKRDWHGYVIKQ